jgi:hypothetical protein
MPPARMWSRMRSFCSKSRGDWLRFDERGAGLGRRPEILRLNGSGTHGLSDSTLDSNANCRGSNVARAIRLR